VCQLVVRAAADDARGQGGDGVVVQRAAECAGGVDVEIGADQGGGVGGDADPGCGEVIVASAA
jgi:hypothetical protein